MTTPTTPVEKAVKKEIAKSSPSWIRRDWLVVGVLFVVLAVLSSVQILSLRQIDESVRNSDALSRCFTPGTRCFTFQAEQEAEGRAYLKQLMETTALCTLVVSGAVNSGEIPFTPEAMDTHYKQCVEDRAAPPPTPPE